MKNALPVAGRSSPVIRPRSSFDMEQLYWEWKVGPGDYLLAQVEDWQKGKFSLSPIPKESISDKNQQEWVSALDKGFAKLFSEITWPQPPDEELARAVFRADRSCIEKPALNIGAYLNTSPLVGQIVFEGKNYLWKKTGETAAQHMEKAGTMEEGLKGSYLEELLARYEVPVPMPYAEACIRQSIEEDYGFSRLLRDIFTGVYMDMLGQEELLHLAKAVENYRNRLYNKMENTITSKKLTYERNKFVLLYQSIMEWFIQIENQFDDIETVDLSILKEIQETAFGCVDVLHILNSSPKSLDDQTKAALEERYRILLQSFHTKAEIVHEQLMEEKFAVRRKERLQSVNAAEYMIMDVTIEDLEPPVSRTLRVPETMTLGDLHYVLQLSFGWEDYHLHSFYIGSTEYTDMETYEQEFIDEAQARDEESVLISEIPGVGEKLLYVYDFGDDWRHEISLRQIIPASKVPKDEHENAVCLDAQGAGPPEDCGGLPGYQKLVQAVTTPASQRTSGQEEFVYWAGSWSPDNFSLNEINSLLAKL